MVNLSNLGVKNFDAKHEKSYCFANQLKAVGGQALMNSKVDLGYNGQKVHKETAETLDVLREQDSESFGDVSEIQFPPYAEMTNKEVSNHLIR